MWINQNHIAGAKYELLASITFKKQKTVRIYFNRNKLNIFEWEDVRKYLDKFYEHKK